MQVRDATDGDIRFVCDNLCPEDREEQFIAAFPEEATPARLAQALIGARPVTIGHYALGLEPSGEPAALIGAWIQSPGVAALHQIRTGQWHAIARNVFRFYIREFIPQVLMPNVRLAECRVMASHVEARRWLKAFGFREHGEPLPYGSQGQDLVHCVWSNPFARQEKHPHVHELHP